MKKNLFYYVICFFAACCIACSDENVPDISTSAETTFTSFSFSVENNPGSILKDVEAKIVGHEIWISSPFISQPQLKAAFDSKAEKVLVSGKEQVSGVTINDFSSPVIYKLISSKGEEREYKVNFSYSGLPIVIIDTPNKATVPSKHEDWLKNATITILKQNGTEEYSGTTSIRGRGNSTWSFPKKPYALKLDEKAEILGMPKHKRWVLLANWMDRTLMRNDIAFEIARRIMEWAPRGKFVELYLNNKHLGCYYLCEQIKVDKNRVNVDELDEDTDFTDAEQVTGGYILEFDVYGPQDEINYYYTSVKGYPVAIKEPDEEVITSWSHPGFTYISGYTNSVEQLLEADKNSRSRWSGISEMIDINSYIDWWLVHELTLNWEPGHPKSSYMYKKRSGKLYAGPVWDFDWGTFSSNYTDPIITESLWYGYLFKYPEFKTAVKQRWNEVKSSCESIDQYISEIAAQIKDSNEANIKMWPIDGTTNGDENLSFDKAIERMKESYKTRLRVMDNFISGL